MAIKGWLKTPNEYNKRYNKMNYYIMARRKVVIQIVTSCYQRSMPHQGAGSLTFRELPKILSRKYTTPEITCMVRISIWKFVRVRKARLWAHVQSVSLKFSSQVLFVKYTNFERIFWRARETLVKQHPEYSTFSTSQFNILLMKLTNYIYGIYVYKSVAIINEMSGFETALCNYTNKCCVAFIYFLFDLRFIGSSGIPWKIAIGNHTVWNIFRQYRNDIVCRCFLCLLQV